MSSIEGLGRCLDGIERAMITIHSQLKSQNVFEPEALRVMAQAFQDACNALHIFAGDERGRQVIATRIIDLAGSGLLEAKALRDRVLSEARTAA
jgi:hypothetical protein